MDFKYKQDIEIRASTDNWGPLPFGFADAIPAGETITACTVSGYAGALTPADATIVNDVVTFAGKTAIPLVDTDTPPACSGTDVSVRLKYPGDDYKGAATLIFVITLAGGGIHSFFFNGVVIK